MISGSIKDLIEKLMLTVVDEGRLPEPQKRFYDFISKQGKEWTDPEAIANNEYFFWILSDGSTVASGSGGGLHHCDGARLAGTTLSNLMSTGALRGTYFGRVGLEVQAGPRISREQITAAQYLIEASGGEVIIDVIDREGNFLAWYHVNRKISNDLLYNILNGGGQVKQFQKTMDEIAEMDQE